MLFRHSQRGMLTLCASSVNRRIIERLYDHFDRERYTSLAQAEQLRVQLEMKVRVPQHCWFVVVFRRVLLLLLVFP